mgnify:CR=1 FL=1
MGEAEIYEAEADIDEMKGKLTMETNVSKLKCLKQKCLFETIVFRANEKQTFQLGCKVTCFNPKQS